VEARPQLSLLIDCLVGLVIAVTGYGLMAQGLDAANGNRIWTIFPSRHHLSAILAVLFPLLAWLALEAENLPRRLAATAAVIGCGFGLMISLERSAWIAVTVGLTVGLLLAARASDWEWTRQSWRPSLAVAATCLLVAAGFFFVSDVDAVVAQRSRQLAAAVHGQDQSFAWRVRKWRGAAAMVAARPGWGWGPGRFVLYQEPYTHLGLTQAEVRSTGASFDEMAYNDYLQTAAELGLPGLALYLLILVSFFSKAGHAFYQLPRGLRRTVLLGCIAGIAAQMIDAMANGSWRYSECSFYFWLILGLGMAVTRMAYQPGKEVVDPVRSMGLPWKPP
jgi:putative inorganic carbon (HCO3(-)) transporter